MEFIDLKVQQNRIKDQLDRNIRAVLVHGQYIMGPEVRELEQRLADFIGVSHAISCSSGTDALLMALMAYDIGPGHAVFTTPFTFIATAEVISLLGATPVFVDIDPKTYTLDPVHLDRAIRALKANDPAIYPLPAYNASRSGISGPKSPAGIIPVDLFGLPADYKAIHKIAADNGLFVIEDAAQSFGAAYMGGKAGSLGHIGATSFFPAKPLGCYGDGGMCFTDDDVLAKVMESIRVHGKGVHKYDNARIGINGRLDTIQAAILNAKFDIFPEEVDLRKQVARRYDNLLSACSSLSLPSVPDGRTSVWAQYSVLAKDENHRTGLQEKLKSKKIPTAVYYPKPLHLQTAYSFLGYKDGDFPVSENCSRRIFSLPMHPYLSVEEQEMIAEALKKG